MRCAGQRGVPARRITRAEGGERTAVGSARDRTVDQHLRVLFNFGAIRELSDGQLLERFATDRGEAAELAFATLIERHGPMVWRVCRGVLGDPDDSQDAFQATFLVLIQKARGLWVRDSIGPWLHQVAFRTASCARVSAARRRRLERGAAVPVISPQRNDFDFAGPLHEELARLPDRLRAAVVLCDLEGRSHEQAARQLGWPIGTVKSRLARGRDRLRARLLRRGLAPEPGLLATALATASPDLQVPPPLVTTTTQAGLHILNTRTLAPGVAALLAREVLRAMTITQLTRIATLLLMVGATASGVVVVAQNDKPGDTPAAANADAKPTRIPWSLVAKGSLEPSHAEEFYCQVPGGTTILSIVEEGTKVKKDQVVCELDSSALRDRLVNQTNAIRVAEADYLNAKLEREVAELAVVEYAEGVHRGEMKVLATEAENHRKDIERTSARIERTERALKQIQGKIIATPTDILAELTVQDHLDEARRSLARETANLEAVVSKRQVSEKYTFPRNLSSLKAEVEKNRKRELETQNAWEALKSFGEKIERQIAACTIKASSNGIVIHSTIEAKATVHDGQKILSIANLDQPMLVNVKAEEAWVDRIEPGKQVHVRVDAFPDQILTGVVVDVSPRPDRALLAATQRKLYPTHVRLNETQPMLRPGMTATVELDLDANVTASRFPRDFLLELSEGTYLRVIKPDGKLDLRNIMVVQIDDQTVSIRSGLEPGDRIPLNNPDPQLQQLREVCKRSNREELQRFGRSIDQMRYKLSQLHPEALASVLSWRDDPQRTANLNALHLTEDEQRALKLHIAW